MKAFRSFFRRFTAKSGSRSAEKPNRCDGNTFADGKKRLTKKLDVISEELAECGDADKFRLWGELITGSLYRLSGKAKFAEVENYYSDPPEKVKIPLDEKLTASQNAARYYKNTTS